MANISLDDLGLSKQEIAERVIDRLVDYFLRDLYDTDENGEPTGESTKFHKSMLTRVANRIDEAIDEIALQHVVPNVEGFIENVTLQQTNQWGERIKSPVTFREYLTQRAEAWLTEDVDFQGKPKTDSYSSFRKAGTRIAFMIDKHLAFHIEQAMKAAVQDAHNAIVKGIQDTVATKLAGLKVSFEAKVKS